MVDPAVERIAKLGLHNASRALHKFVHKNGKTLPVDVSARPLLIRRKKKGELSVQHPMLLLSSWMVFLLGTAGAEFLLAGSRVQDGFYQSVFGEFWSLYEKIDPDHPIFTLKTPEERSRTLPFALHGDEGRGLAKDPIAIWSFQPVVPHSGPTCLNTAGCLCYFGPYGSQIVL